MRQLTAAVAVHAPSGFALAFLNTHVRDRSGGSGDPHLRLRLPLPGGSMIEHDITVRLNWLPKGMAEDVQLAVSWVPANERHFPSFGGRIEALPEGAAACNLRITGEYHAPHGLIGKLFDALLGHRIARASVDDLLQFFRRAIEDDYSKRIDSY